mmetsp:Transcript_21369/g.46289  ORF Transcript_21369/g.46289 Transcript_21369/m.46289 type:complete len:265 (-) Transcript_21369:2064-2858(-)
MHLIIPTNIQHVLNHVVSICILHQLQTLLNYPRHQMRPSHTVTRVKTTLDNTTSVTMTSHILNTGCNGIEDELSVLIGKLEQDTLNSVVTMAINAKTSSRRFKRIRQNLCSRILLLALFGLVLPILFLLILLSVFLCCSRSGLSLLPYLLVHRTNFHNLLHRPRPVQVQTGIHEPRANTLDQDDTFFRSDAFQNLLEKVVAKGIDHGLRPEGEPFIEDGSCSRWAIFIKRLLEETASNLITRETTHVAQQRTEGWTMGRGIQVG